MYKVVEKKKGSEMQVEKRDLNGLMESGLDYLVMHRELLNT